MLGSDSHDLSVTRGEVSGPPTVGEHQGPIANAALATPCSSGTDLLVHLMALE